MTIAERKLALFRHIDKLKPAEVEVLYNKLIGRKETKMRDAVSFSDVKRRFDVVATVEEDKLHAFSL
jgi:hypothetical protein